MQNPVKRPIAKQKTDAEEHLMKMSSRVGDLRVWATPAYWVAHGLFLYELDSRFWDVISQESQHARFRHLTILRPSEPGTLNSVRQRRAATMS